MIVDNAAALVATFAPITADAADGKVQYDDLKLQTAGVVKVADHGGSGNNRIALMVKGGDRSLLKTLYTAAGKVEVDADRDVWFLHSVDDKPSDGRTEVDIYVSVSATVF